MGILEGAEDAPPFPLRLRDLHSQRQESMGLFFGF